MADVTTPPAPLNGWLVGVRTRQLRGRRSVLRRHWRLRGRGASWAEFNARMWAESTAKAIGEQAPR